MAGKVFARPLRHRAFSVPSTPYIRNDNFNQTSAFVEMVLTSLISNGINVKEICSRYADPTSLEVPQ